jgi:hypothetical protein
VADDEETGTTVVMSGGEETGTNVVVADDEGAGTTLQLVEADGTPVRRSIQIGQASLGYPGDKAN